MVVVFNLLPMIFLFLYPCACCRKCLNFCRLNNPSLFIFKPYRDHIQNIVDAGFLLLFALGHVMYIAKWMYVTEPELSATRPFNDIMTLIALFFLFYGFIIIARVSIPKQILVKFKNCTSFIVKKLPTNNVQQEEFFPECPCHRINIS